MAKYMKKSVISVLKINSRYLQSPGLKTHLSNSPYEQKIKKDKETRR